MLEVTKTQIIDQDFDKYLSFPDIVKSPNAKNRYFLIYREGDNHHPVWSKLILQVSNNGGKDWEKVTEFHVTLEDNGFVWNCPRLSYVDGHLYIICDQKSSTTERTAMFKTIFLVSRDEGKSFHGKTTFLPGMVPDKIIEFKGNLFCANHKVKSAKNDLVQLISWSRDDGMTWFDTNILAHDRIRQYCEASVVNMGEYLIAYLRDNSGHERSVYTSCSFDGVLWDAPQAEVIFGQRVTALRDEDREGFTVGAYRDTQKPLLSETLQLSAFEHDVNKCKFEISKIDWEYPENQYHFGYTGMTRIAPNKYIIAYYIKQDENRPFIKLAYVTKVKG